MMCSIPHSLRNFFLDMDGTIYLSGVPLPGALAAVSRLRCAGVAIRFLTNKPLFSRQAYATKLKRLGFGATRKEVVTSAHVMEMTLARHHRGVEHALRHHGVDHRPVRQRE